MNQFKAMLKKDIPILKLNTGDIITVIDVHLDDDNQAHLQCLELPPIVNHKEKIVILQTIPEKFLQYITENELSAIDKILSI